jgi:hypothetical protein
MTPERLAEIRARAEAATPGPWRVVGRDFAIKGFPQVELPTKEQHYFPVNFPCDADFIAAARTDIPDLLAYVDALREALAPFALYANAADPDGSRDPDGILLTDADHGHEFAVRWKHIKAARAALGTESGRR